MADAIDLAVPVRLLGGDSAAMFAINLGTEREVSAPQFLRAFESASRRGVPYELAWRREGYAAVWFADASLVAASPSSQATREFDAMCKDAWGWKARLWSEIYPRWQT